MFRSLLLALSLVAFSLAGCNPAGKLIGTWQADVASTAESSGPLGALAASMMSALNVEADFKGDGTCSLTGGMLGQSVSKQGRWKYHNSDGETLIIKVQMDGDDSEREVRVKFLENDRLEMIPPGSSSNSLAKGPIPFKRKKAN